MATPVSPADETGPFECPRCGRVSTAKFKAGDLTVCWPCAWQSEARTQAKADEMNERSTRADVGGFVVRWMTDQEMES